jgi:hypothetical protein
VRRTVVLALLLVSIVVFGQKPEPKIYRLKNGFRISQTCLRSRSLKVANASTESLTKGLACLDAMPGQQVKEHAENIRNLMKEKAPVLTCEELESDTLALATLPHQQPIPSIKINNSKNQEHLDNIILHELFHSIGYGHEMAEVEYAYACAECCITEGNGGDRELACRLCQRPKDQVRDLDYYNDLAKLFTDVKRPKFALRRLINYLKANPTSQEARIHLRSALARGYPGLALKAENDEGVARYIEELFDSIDVLLTRPELTHKQVLPSINQIISMGVVDDAFNGLNNFYSAIQDLGQETERIELVWLYPSKGKK